MSSDYETGRFADVSDLDHADEWENPTLERFLDALAASLNALPGLYLNRAEVLPDPPIWKLMAEAHVCPVQNPGAGELFDRRERSLTYRATCCHRCTELA